MRHKPDDLGLTLDAQGWASTSAVVAAVKARGYRFSAADLRRIVADDDKARYALSLDGRRIRAQQGHSLTVEHDFKPSPPPQHLFHGTSQRVVGDILRGGLLKMARHHVHLSSDIETASKVGARRRGDTVIFCVDAAAMSAENFVFLQSHNGVWLTDHVPPRYLSLQY